VHPAAAPAQSFVDGEVLNQTLGVIVFPPRYRLVTRVLAVEFDQQPGEFAPHRASSEELWEYRQIDEPIGVPGCPIRIISVGDGEHNVVRLSRLVEELADRLNRVLCVLRHATSVRPFHAEQRLVRGD